VIRWAAPIATLLLACGSAPPFAARDPADGAPSPLSLQAELLVTEAALTGTATRTEPLVLDLGSAFAATLPAEALAALGARRTDELVRFVDARGVALRSPVWIVPRLAWGGWVWRDVRVVEARWSDGFAPPLRVGVIGRRLLDGLRVIVRVADGVVRVAPSAPCGPGGVAFTLDGGGILDARVAGAPARVLLDSAATAHIATRPGGGGARVVSIGGHDLGALDVVALDLPGVPADLILGVPLFATRREVVIDLGARCLELTP